MTPAFAALVGGALVSASAWAGPPEAQFFAGAGGATSITTPGAVSGIVIGDLPGAGGSDSASTTATLTASARGAAGPSGSAGSQAEIVYYGEVVGSPGGVPIPLSILGSISAEYGGGGGPGVITGGGADASIAWGPGLTIGLGSAGAEVCESLNPCGFPTFASVNAIFNIDADQIFVVALDAQGSATNGASYVASIDPIISILPDFLADHPALSLELSPDVMQPSSITSVPEPSAWAMMLLGFAGLGYVSYRRAREPRAA